MKGLFGKYQHIEINGSSDTWHIIDQRTVEGHDIYLLESEQHGLAVNDLIVDEKGNILLENEYSQGLAPFIELIKRLMAKDNE